MVDQSSAPGRIRRLQLRPRHRPYLRRQVSPAWPFATCGVPSVYAASPAAAIAVPRFMSRALRSTRTKPCSIGRNARVVPNWRVPSIAGDRTARRCVSLSPASPDRRSSWSCLSRSELNQPFRRSSGTEGGGGGCPANRESIPNLQTGCRAACGDARGGLRGSRPAERGEGGDVRFVHPQGRRPELAISRSHDVGRTGSRSAGEALRPWRLTATHTATLTSRATTPAWTFHGSGCPAASRLP